MKGGDYKENKCANGKKKNANSILSIRSNFTEAKTKNWLQVIVNFCSVIKRDLTSRANAILSRSPSQINELKKESFQNRVKLEDVLL